MGRVLAGWHLAMAIGGALLMVLGARPFRSGPWLHTNGFVWLSVTLAAVSLGVLGGLVEGWMLKRHLPLFAAVIVAAVSIPMLMVSILFIGRMAHTEAYVLAPGHRRGPTDRVAGLPRNRARRGAADGARQVQPKRCAMTCAALLG